jgi:hypothetical protein
MFVDTATDPGQLLKKVQVVFREPNRTFIHALFFVFEVVPENSKKLN